LLLLLDDVDGAVGVPVAIGYGLQDLAALQVFASTQRFRCRGLFADLGLPESKSDPTLEIVAEGSNEIFRVAAETSSL
jgi:hypothetical protein